MQLKEYKFTRVASQNYNTELKRINAEMRGKWFKIEIKEKL